MAKLKPAVSLEVGGFSLIETMVAVAVIAGLGLAIYRLQIAELSASQQLITRHNMQLAASRISEQIYSHLNYVASNSAAVIGGYAADCANASCYAEINYNDHSSAPGRDCSILECNDQQYADFILYRWKQNFKQMNVPYDTIKAIVCADELATPPAFDNPKCGSGRLVVKIVWQSQVLSQDAELGATNFIVLRVPER